MIAHAPPFDPFAMLIRRIITGGSPGDAGIAFLAFGTNGEKRCLRPDGSQVQRVASLKAEQFTWAARRLPLRRC